MKIVHGEVSKQSRQVLVAFLLFAIVMLGTALRLYRLDAKNLGGDEIITATIAQQDVRSILQFHLEEAGNPPLLSLITHLFFTCCGHSEFVARLPAALFGSLSILLAYKAGEVLWTRDVGITGAFLLAVSAYHVWFSQVARYYALMVFLALLSLIFLLKALEKNSKRLWIGFILCTSLSIYNHYFAFFFLPAEVIFGAWKIAENWLSHTRKGGRDLATQRSRTVRSPARQAVMFCLSLCLIGMLYLPWVPRLLKRSSPALASGAAVPSTASLQLSLSFLWQVLTTYGTANSAGLLLWLGVLLVGLTTCDRKRLLLVLLWIGTPFAFVAVVGPRHFLLPKYVLYTLPLYLLVVATGIDFIGRFLIRPLSKVTRARRWPALAGVIITLSVLMVGGVNLPPLRDHYLGQKEDWPSAVAYIRENIAETDVMIVDGQAYRGYNNVERPTKALTYYFSLLGEDITILPAQRGLPDALSDVAHPEAGIWGVLWHHSDLRSLEGMGQEVEILEFPRVAVVKVLDPRGNALEDSASVLRALIQVQPRAQGRFDLHLALAEIYLRTERFEQARLELDIASQVRPDSPAASRDLSEARAELQQVYSPTESIQYPLWRSLGEMVAFLGYNTNVEAPRPGDSLRITLWWQALAEMDRDYSVFVHAVDHGGRIWAQHDQLLLRDGRGTSTWKPGEIVTQLHGLELPANAPPDEYAVRTGMYYWETGERLPVWDERGRRVADDAIHLAPITVNQ